MKPVVALVVAAGSGTRLGGESPKALREVGGIPLVARSVARLAQGGCTDAVVVLADGTQDAFAAALASSPIPVRLVVGGAARQDSVRLGLDAVAADSRLASSTVVLVHDAARALVPSVVVARVIEAVRQGAAAVVPVIPIIDTIRQVGVDGSVVVDRTTLRAVQTPQGFDRAALTDAHARIDRDRVDVTDDAAACEYVGHAVVLVEGARESLKVTEPLDLVLAEAIAGWHE